MSRKRKEEEPAGEPAPPEEIPVASEAGEETTAEQELEPRWRLSQVIEAVLFASPKPCTAKELLAIIRGAAAAAPENPDVAGFGRMKEARIREALDELAAACATSGVYELCETAAGWQFVTRADFSPWLRQLYPENRSARLSAPAMETLAIIAYRQPITRADIEAVRGVAVDGVMQTLLDRGLVKIAGRAEVPGRPLLYETTQFFMEHFGLRTLDELPNAGELRQIELPRAPASEPPPAEEAPAAAVEPDGGQPALSKNESASQT